MTSLIDNLPIPAKREQHHFHSPTGRSDYQVFAFEPVVWVGLTAHYDSDPPSQAFPTILDTGCTNSLLINRRHLDWADISPAVIHECAMLDPHDKPLTLRVNGRANVPLYNFNIWLFGNVRSTRDLNHEQQPTWLPVKRGVGVFDGPAPHPSKTPGTGDEWEEFQSKLAQSPAARPPLQPYPRLPTLGLHPILCNHLSVFFVGGNGGRHCLFIGKSKT